MSLETFIVKFSELFDDTDPCEISANTKFHELDEWSSLIALSVIAMVDEEFDVSIKGDDVINAITVEDLYQNIIDKC